MLPGLATHILHWRNSVFLGVTRRKGPNHVIFPFLDEQDGMGPSWTIRSRINIIIIIITVNLYSAFL